MRLTEAEKREKYTVPAVEAAVRILGYLSSYRHSRATLTEISEALQINRSTCLRILFTLMTTNMLDFNPTTRTYSLGPYVIILGERARELLDYFPIMMSYVKKASQVLESTVVLVQRFRNDSIMYLAKEEPPVPVHVTVRTGQIFPITAGSHGKCLLAYLQQDEVDQVLDKVGLVKYTDKSIVSRDEYKAELQRVKERGYAISIEEHFPGVDGIAAPIAVNDEVNMTLSAIMIHGMHSLDKIHELAKILKSMASELSSKLSSLRFQH